MVSLNWANREPLSTGKMLQTLGIFTSIVSVAGGLLVWFVLPSRCSFLSSIYLFLLAGLLMFGLVAMVVGKVLQRRNAFK